jgi:hypothetical protein
VGKVFHLAGMADLVLPTGWDALSREAITTKGTFVLHWRSIEPFANAWNW